jgi:hypothetical protein
MKRRPSLVLLILALSCARTPDCSFASPEATLECYIVCQRNGDSDCAAGTLLNKTSYWLPGKLDIPKYTIEKRIIHTSATALIEPGDVELQVLELVDGEQERFTYFFRKANGFWRISGYTSWKQPL